MIRRSFKPAKSKTSLKLVVSRIKLLKNKRDVQVKQLKRELAQLLESGQERSAMIRVEHVVREEKTIAAYDLIEIYCELIVARLPIIESQKNCPIDLKEAIASVIFASPRCADLPELMDIRKQFTAKYGKEFINAAIELRPDSGASRLLVEKLSAKAPDGPTKLKILSAIADEHNIQWDPKSYGEKDSNPPEDLLNGPNTAEKANMMHVDSPKFQDSNVQSGTNSHVPPNSHENHDVPGNTRDGRSFSYYQNSAPAGSSLSQESSSRINHPNLKNSEGMDFRHSVSGDGNSFPSRQNWSTNFKDATSAAQAAAESAELASMAARAAVELSSQGKISRQYSTESPKSVSYGSRNQSLQKHGVSKAPSEHLGGDQVSYTHSRSNIGRQYEDKDSSSINNNLPDKRFPSQESYTHPDENENYTHHHGSMSERQYEDKNSSKNKNLSVEGQRFSRDGLKDIDDHSVKRFHEADRYSQKNSSESKQSGHFGETDGDIKKHSSKSEVHVPSKYTDDVEEETRFVSQLSQASSHYHQGSTAERQYEGKNSSKNKNLSVEGEKFSRDGLKDIDDHSVKKFHEADRFSPKNSSEVKQSGHFSEADANIKKHSSKFEVDVSSKYTDDVEEESRFVSQLSRASSHSHSSTLSDDYNVTSGAEPYNVQSDFSENIFAGYDTENPPHQSTEEKDLNNKRAVIFDDSGSDNDEFKINLDGGHKGQEYGQDFSRISPTHKVNDSNSWNLRQSLSESQGRHSSQSHLFTLQHLDSLRSDGSMSSPTRLPVDDLPPMVFDNSDGSGTESEDELTKPPKAIGIMNNEIHNTKDITKGGGNMSTESSFKEKVGFSKSGLQPSSVVSKALDRNDRNESAGKLGYGEGSSRISRSRFDRNEKDHDSLHKPVDELKQSEYHQPSRFSAFQEAEDNNALIFKSDDMKEDSESRSESSLLSGSQLNLGISPGGLRNKAFLPPSYTKRPAGNTSLSNQEAKFDSVKTEISPSIVSGTQRQELLHIEKEYSEANKKLSSGNLLSRVDSSDDDSTDEPSKQTFSQDQYTNKTGVKENQRYSRSIPRSYLHSASSDSEEELPKTTSNENTRTNTGFSRRTKLNPNISEKTSYARNTVVVSEPPSVDLDYGVEKKTSMPKSSYRIETRQKAQPEYRKSDPFGSSEQSGSRTRTRTTDQAPATMTSSTPKVPTHEGSLKSSKKEQPLNIDQDKVTSGSSSSSGFVESPSAEKARHVHPKLPDFDTISAQFLSLRSNRK